MRVLPYCLIGLVPVALCVPADCVDNNCGRAVTGTAGSVPIETRMAECSSFMTETVYAIAHGLSITETVTIYGAPGPFIKKRDPKTESVPSFATECPQAKFFSSACSCWGITAGTTTIATATETTTTTATPTCYRGLQWAFYKVSQGTGPGQIPFNPGNKFYTEINSKVDEIKTWAPQATGVGSVIGGIRSTDWPNGVNPPNIYDYTGPAGIDSQYIAVDHRFYLYTKEAGTYTVTFINANEVAFAWVGTHVDSQIWTYPQVSVCQTFATGQFIPCRILYVNAQGGATFELNITTPDRTIALSRNSQSNNHIVQYCDGGSDAVPYGPWGTAW